MLLLLDSIIIFLCFILHLVYHAIYLPCFLALSSLKFAILLFHCFFVVCSLQVLACTSPSLYAAHDHVKPHVHTNEEMAWHSTIVFPSATHQGKEFCWPKALHTGIEVGG